VCSKQRPSGPCAPSSGHHRETRFDDTAIQPRRGYSALQRRRGRFDRVATDWPRRGPTASAVLAIHAASKRPAHQAGEVVDAPSRFRLGGEERLGGQRHTSPWTNHQARGRPPTARRRLLLPIRRLPKEQPLRRGRTGDEGGARRRHHGLPASAQSFAAELLARGPTRARIPRGAGTAPPPSRCSCGDESRRGAARPRVGFRGGCPGLRGVEAARLALQAPVPVGAPLRVGTVAVVLRAAAKEASRDV